MSDDDPSLMDTLKGALSLNSGDEGAFMLIKLVHLEMFVREVERLHNRVDHLNRRLDAVIQGGNDE